MKKPPFALTIEVDSPMPTIADFNVEMIKNHNFIESYIYYLNITPNPYEQIYQKYLNIVQKNILLPSSQDNILSPSPEKDTFIDIQKEVNELINEKLATQKFKYADGEKTKKELFLAHIQNIDTDAFTRKTIISLPSFSDSRFVKCSTLIYLNSRSLKDATFAFIHEIVMQMYAFDEKPKDDSIDIPQIHSYGIFLVNNNYYMYIEMNKFNIKDTVTTHNDCYVELLAYVKYHLKMETIKKNNERKKNIKKISRRYANTINRQQITNSLTSLTKPSKKSPTKITERRSSSLGGGGGYKSKTQIRIKPDFLALFQSETYANLEAKIGKLSEWLSGLHLIHNDAHLENILIKCDGSSIAVIDFGRTCFDIRHSNLFETTSHSILSFTGNSESAANAKLGLKYLIQCSINKTHCDTFLNHASKIKRLGGKSRVTRRKAK